MTVEQILNKAKTHEELNKFIEEYKDEIQSNPYDKDFIITHLAKKFDTDVDSIKLMLELQ